MSSIAIHQPNFMFGWFDHLYKLKKCDVFVVMVNCQFEKNGYQNRANIFDNWWTLPVQGGTCQIKDKKFTNGMNLATLNVTFLMWICGVLGIDTKKIHMDFETEKNGTDRIIEICKRFNCDEYLSNPEASEKYLDISQMFDEGIKFVPISTPHKKHIFEMFNDHGIDGTIKLLNREYKGETQHATH